VEISDRIRAPVLIIFVGFIILLDGAIVGYKIKYLNDKNELYMVRMRDHVFMRREHTVGELWLDP